MEHNHENQGIQLDSKIAYEVTLNRLLLKEKEIVELRALCEQLAQEVHNLQHTIEALQNK